MTFTWTRVPPRNGARDETNRAFVPVTETEAERSADWLVVVVWIGAALVLVLALTGWI